SQIERRIRNIGPGACRGGTRWLTRASIAGLRHVGTPALERRDGVTRRQTGRVRYRTRVGSTHIRGCADVGAAAHRGTRVDHGAADRIEVVIPAAAIWLANGGQRVTKTGRPRIAIGPRART